MKKNLLLILLFISLFFLVNNSVIALENDVYYTTSKGVKLTQEEYNLLKENFDDYYIEMFSEDEMKEVLKSPKSIKFIKPVNENYGVTPLLISCPSNSVCIDAGDHITTFTVTAFPSLKEVHLNQMTIWDETQVATMYKSFDISAWMWNKTSGFVVSGIDANQYTDSPLSGNSEINYSFKGGNSTYANNGYGVAMNIVNDSRKKVYLELTVKGYFTKTGTYKFTGTYLHANKSVSKEEAINYTFSSTGLGNVINFKDLSLKSKYTSYGSKSFSYAVPTSMIK